MQTNNNNTTAQRAIDTCLYTDYLYPSHYCTVPDATLSSAILSLSLQGSTCLFCRLRSTRISYSTPILYSDVRQKLNKL